MKVNHEFTNEMLDNGAKFKSPFFDRFPLSERNRPLKLNDDVEKNYLFPTLYGHVTCAQAIYLCDYDKAKSLLPHPSMEPVKMLNGRSLVALACYVYRNVLNIPAYNEIAMTIPVMVGASFSPPVLPMLWNGFKSFGYYVFNMPVTSKENQIRGRKIWGLPKVVHQIDINQDDQYCETSAIDENGNDYFRLKVPTQGKSQHFDVSANLYSKNDGELLQSQTCFQGSFNVNKNTAQLWGAGKVENDSLTLGEGQYADQLRFLELESSPFQFRYAKSMNACFDLPNANFSDEI